MEQGVLSLLVDDGLEEQYQPQTASKQNRPKEYFWVTTRLVREMTRPYTAVNNSKKAEISSRSFCTKGKTF